ncbi:LamG domain-containing protein [Paracoccaceae bacterium Fryx2]|nr:LamG domain-containing protein [Paracoccaceae bacterium Fryx2]
MTDVTAYAAQFDGTSAYAQAPGVSAYDFGTGDFTIEAWVLTTGGGPVATQMGSDVNTGAGWGLFVLPDGRLELVTFNAGSSVTATTQVAPATFDGSWHHIAAVRVGVDMMILFDGVPQVLQLEINGVPPLNVSGNLPLTIGATTLVGAQTGRQFFAGSIDEFRLWNVALQTWKIDQNIYHVVTIDRENLVALYGFDDKTGADSSGKGNTLSFQGPVLFTDPAFYFVPEGQPFMAVQVRLMQDFHLDAANPSAPPTEVKALRVALSPRASDGQRQAAALTLSTDVATTIHTQGRSVAIGPATPVTLQTNSLNQLNVALFLEDDSLVAPLLKVHADFMEAGESILVPLDRQIHFTLSQVSGADLQDVDDPLLAPAVFTAAQADAVAATVSNVMAAAVQHDMQPADEMYRAPGTPLRRRSLTSRRVVLRADAPGAPERENYLPVEMENPLLMPQSDLLRCHYLAQDVAVERVVIPTFMPVPHFRFDVQSRSFTPLTQAQAGAAIMSRMASPHMLTALGADGATEERLDGISDLWDQFVAGVLNVVDWVVSIGQSIVEGVRVVIAYVADGVTKFFDFVVATVVEAAEFVVGMFRAIGVALEKVIDFLSALFNPADILRTHRVLYRFMQETSTFGLACLNDMKTSADAMFDDARTTVDTYFDQAIARLGASTAADQGEGAALNQPPSVQADYVNQNVAESNMQAPGNVTNAPSAAVLDTAATGIVGGAGADVATLRTNNQTAITAYASASDDFMNEIMATLLTVLKSSLDMAIDVAKAVTDAVLDLLIASYQLVTDMVDTRLDVPLLTWFYEEFICAGDGSKLSFLNLFALAGAVPLTILNKLFQGSAPFSAAFETKFMTQTWQDYGFYHLPSAIRSGLTPRRAEAFAALEGTDDPDWKDKLAYAQGFIFSVSVAVWFGGVAFKDSTNVSVLDPGFSTVSMTPIVVGEFVAQLASYPIHDSYPPNSAAALEVSIWSLQWLPFAMDAGDLGLAVKKPPGAAAYVNTAQNGIVGVWGIIHASMFVALYVLELIALVNDTTKSQAQKIGDAVDIGFKVSSNVTSTAPEWIGFARYGMADPEVKAAVVIVDVVAAAGVALITLGRTIAAMVRHALIQPR